MFNREQAIKEAQEMIRELEKFGFGYVDLDNSTEYAEWTRCLHGKCDLFSFPEGSTRQVIVHEECDYVIKLMTRAYTNRETGEVQIYNNEVDYNESEAYIYDEAEKRGLAEYFAGMVRLPDYTNARGTYHLYAMLKCDVNYDEMASTAAEYSGSGEYHYYMNDHGERIDEWEYDNLSSNEQSEFWSEYEESSDWGDYESMRELAKSEWGCEAERKVDEFLYYYGVNDCHAGNWGWYNGFLKLTDYAGYCRKVNADYFHMSSRQSA